MTCAEFKELAAAYALGALTDEERAACDAHLENSQHEGCFEALAEAYGAAEKLATSLPPVKPRPQVWSAIEAATVRASSTKAQPPARASRTPWLVAAALLLICGGLGWSRFQTGKNLAAREQELATARAKADKLADETELRHRCEVALTAARGQLRLRAEAVAMLAAPSARVFALAPQKGMPPNMYATAMVDLKAQRAMVVAGGLDPSAEQDFELWVIKGGEKRPAGLLRAEPGQPLVASVDPAKLVGGADAFAVTLEPRGGGPTPRGPIVLVGALPKS